MSNAGKRGRFVWYDLMTSDPKAAEDFYGKLIGWGTQQFEGGEQPYKMWTNNETPLGGVMELPAEARAAGAPPHWMAYVAVEDVDAAVEQAVGLGGSTLHPPTSIEGAGRFAVMADPQGAAFAVYTHSGEEEGPSAPPQVGAAGGAVLVERARNLRLQGGVRLLHGSFRVGTSGGDGHGRGGHLPALRVR